MKRFLLLVLFGCNDSSDRFERLDRLRAIGVARSPTSPVKNGEEVSLTAYVVSPSGATLEQSIEDTGLFAEPPSSVEIGAPTNEALGKYALYSFPVKVRIPDTLTKRRVRVAFAAVTADDREPFVYDIPILGEAKSLAFAKFEVGDTTLSEVPLEVNITSDESYKVSWFVSDGEVKSRRAAKTTWKKDSEFKDERFVVVTARGLTSGNFVIEKRTGL